MIDEFHDRNYQAARDALNAELARALTRIGRAVRNAFVVLNRIEYSAPWASAKRPLRQR